MKQIIVMMAAVVLVGQSVVADEKKLIADPVVIKAIRQSLEKHKGQLTVRHLEKIKYLNLKYSKITDAGLKEVAKLQNLREFSWTRTKATAEAAAELSKALPNCKIYGP